MKILGLEIRTFSEAKTIYDHVDSTLAEAQIPKGSVSPDVQVSAVAHALQKMLCVKSYFNICTVDQCIKIAQITIQSERYEVYHALHCMHWNEMLPDFRKTIVAMILDDFRSILNPESEEAKFVVLTNEGGTG